MKKIFCIAFFVFSFVLSYSQNKQLTIDEAVLGRNQFSPEDLINMRWKDNSSFTYIKDYSELFQIEIGKNTKNSILKLVDLNEKLKAKGFFTVPYFYDYSWIGADNLIFENEEGIVAYNLTKNVVDYAIHLKENSKNARFCKANSMLAYTIDNNLFIADKQSNVQQITNDIDPGIVNGDSYVHRQEFGIDNGIFWSPKGNYLAFYRKDETMVADYPLVDVSTRIASVKNIKYPMAGETSEQVTLGIYDLKTKKTIFLKTGEPKDHYLARISWDPSEKFIYVAELNRGQNDLKLNKYDAFTGEFVNTLFEEKNPKYVEPEHEMYFLKTNPNQFVWQSERDGYNHLYLYETSGKLLKQLTKGSFVITGFMGFDGKEENFYVVSTLENPIERHLYKYNLKNDKYVKLTKQNGSYEPFISPNGEYSVNKYSSTHTPQDIELIDKNGKLVTELLKSNNPLKDYKLGQMSIGTLKAADGKTDLFYRIVRPVDFDSLKKYPVIVYVYGGPHAQLVNNVWLGGAGLWDYYMAQEGYILFTIDNRGSADRGFEFESVIHRQLGVEEMKDQMKGIDFLKSLSYVDKNRVGVYGWSFGGFMTTSLMVNFSETFKVGVAGGPVIDWKYYEVMYGERYMDTPQENPDGYAKTSLLDKAQSLKGRLMLIHGTVDPVVVWQNSQAFVESCVDKGVMLDYFIYPGHEHNVPGKDRLHLMKKITLYFDDFLK